MAVVDYNAILGKRVKVTLKSRLPNLGDLSVTGVCVGFLVTAQDFPNFSNDNEILFLEDGFQEPDFICFDDLELIG